MQAGSEHESSICGGQDVSDLLGLTRKNLAICEHGKLLVAKKRQGEVPVSAARDVWQS